MLNHLILYTHSFIRSTSATSSSLIPNLPSSPIPSPLYNNDPLYFLNKDAREISSTLFFHETIPIYLGRQRKNLFYYKIFSGETIEFCRSKYWKPARIEAKETKGDNKKDGKNARKKYRMRMSTSLYGNLLSGLVLLVSPDLSYKSDHCKGTIFILLFAVTPSFSEFRNSCAASTEYHFESFEQQVAKVKDANPRLNSGKLHLF